MTIHNQRDMEKPTSISIPARPDVDTLFAHFRHEFSDFRRLAEQGGDHSTIFRKFGLVRWGAGDLEQAARSFVAALALDPDDEWIWEDLSGVYHGAEKPEMALECIGRSIAINDGRARSWLMLATILDGMDDHEGAVSAYSRAKALDDSLAGAHFGLGIIHLKHGRLSLALDSFRRTVERDPGNAFAHVCLGHAHYSVGAFADCARALDIAMTLAPLDPATKVIRANAMTFQAIIDGDITTALANYATLAGLNGEDRHDASQEAFLLLNVHGVRSATHAVGAYRLARDPHDPVRGT